MAIVKLGILLIIIITIIMIAVIKLYDIDEYARKTQTDEYKKREEKVRAVIKKTFIVLGMVVLIVAVSVINLLASIKEKEAEKARETSSNIWGIWIFESCGDSCSDSCGDACEESLCGPGHHEYSCAALFTAINNCK